MSKQASTVQSAARGIPVRVIVEGVILPLRAHPDASMKASPFPAATLASKSRRDQRPIDAAQSRLDGDVPCIPEGDRDGPPCARDSDGSGSATARLKTLFLKAIGLGSLLAGLPAAAQDVTAPDVWQFELVPYLWFSGIRSDIKLGPLPGSTVHIKSSSVLKALDFGAMGTLEARKGRWGGFLDMQYVKLGVSNQFLGGLAGGYNLKYDQTVITVAAFYRILDDPTVQVDVLGGARYIDAHSNLDIPPSLLGLGRRLDNSEAWWNGIVGVRALVPLGDKWSLMGYLDGGQGNATSSWQGILGTSYQYSPMTSFKFGYRYLAVTLDEAALSKVALGGFYAGVGFKF